jgi:protease-4
MNNPNKSSKEKRKTFLIRTIALFLFAFIILIGAFYLFTLSIPSVTGKCVAVVDVNYPLSVSGSPPGLLDSGYPGSGQLAGAIRDLNGRDDVGAVVFVVNSGGGSVVAGGEIRDAIDELDKPSVSYFREVAASGAYYVASGTDYIISDPNALTGSLGVVTTVLSMEGMFEKLGIETVSIQSGDNKDMGSPYANMSPEQKAIMQSVVDEVFLEFREDIVEGREGRLDMELFDEAMDGRIMTGRQAVRVGLVDEAGDRRNAIMKASELSGHPVDSVDEVKLCPVPLEARGGGMLSSESIIRVLEASSGFPLLRTG